MPANGEINEQFGVYKTLCYGVEIAISAGAEFPDCPNHPRLTTEWKNISDDKKPIPHASQFKEVKATNDNAA
jgi:hypothetical protein